MNPAAQLRIHRLLPMRMTAVPTKNRRGSVIPFSSPFLPKERGEKGNEWLLHHSKSACPEGQKRGRKGAHPPVR